MKFLLIHAFPMLRLALTGLIEQQFPGASVQDVDTAAAARLALEREPPQLLVLVLRPDADGGLALLQQLRHEHMLLPMLVISDSESSEDALAVIAAGASGYVSQRCSLDTLREALRLVLAGGTFVPTLLASAGAAAAAPLPAAHDPWAELPLTPRQKGVLNLLVRGLSNKEIARELSVSVDTVKDHVAAVLKALGAVSRTQAALIATQKARG